MICIGCGGGMAALELEGVEVDRCWGCGGMWLDSGELAMLSGGGSEDGSALLERSNEKSRRCPICNKEMRKVMEPASGAMLDRCVAGCGTWFDGGELRTVLAASGKSASNSRAIRVIQEIFKHSCIHERGEQT